MVVVTADIWRDIRWEGREGEKPLKLTAFGTKDGFVLKLAALSWSPQDLPPFWTEFNGFYCLACLGLGQC